MRETLRLRRYVGDLEGHSGGPNVRSKKEKHFESGTNDFDLGKLLPEIATLMKF